MLRSTRVQALTESAILLALATVLSLFTVWKHPMGGSVTPASMLPVMLVAIKRGWRWGVPCAFLYSVGQALLAIPGGNVYPWCGTALLLLACVLLDYLLPFTGLALVAAFRRSGKTLPLCLGVAAACLFRFLCHYASGVLIWSQWAGEEGPWLYSLLYNGGFMLPEMLLTLAAAAVLLSNAQMRRLLWLPA